MCGRDSRTVSSGGSGSGSPAASPAKSTRPAENTSAGASVIGSTMISPRSPCDFRNRPTMTHSGAGMLRRGVLAHGNGAPAALCSDTRLVTRLQHAGFPEQRADGVRRLRTDAEPIARAIRVHFQATLCNTRIVLANQLDESAIARTRGVGDHDAIDGQSLTSNATKANLYHSISPSRVCRGTRAHRAVRKLRCAPGWF